MGNLHYASTRTTIFRTIARCTSAHTRPECNTRYTAIKVRVKSVKRKDRKRKREKEEDREREIAQNDFTPRCRDVLCFRKKLRAGPRERSQIVEIIRGDSSLASLGHGDLVSRDHRFREASREIMRSVVRNSAEARRDVHLVTFISSR